ncbi:MAG: hypothetical protein H6536_06595 [Bacteroidales bacterium]|nr:hypothetical protein [Bacteroidales bacterium]
MVRTVISIMVLGVLLTSCKKHRLDSIDTSGIDVAVEVLRFDSELFTLNPDSLEGQLSRLNAKYGQFSDLFFEGIIRIGKPESPNYSQYLKAFLVDTMVRHAYRDVQTVFPNLDAVNTSLTDAFKRYRYHFPDSKVPTVIAYVSGYNLSVAIDENIVAVGLDRYLGSETPQYRLLGIPRYMANKMTPQKIPSDVVRAWLYGEFAFNDSVENLLSNMIYEGAIIYITRHLLPDEPEHIIHGFSEDQLRWCQRNESDMWTYLIENKQLFITNSLEINKFINDAPFTSGFPQESPGRAAVWLGYRIVDAFMERNSDITLPHLMSIGDYQEILTLAKYKP